MKVILYVGIDVDDKSFHLCGFNRDNGELLEMSCKPNNSSLLSKLRLLESKGFILETCYEATYIGYSLHRFLVSHNIRNRIIAPSLIPYSPGIKTKTDRLDSRKLAIYSSKGLLVPIYIPDIQDEQVRDLIRTRGFLVNKRSSLKRHILSTSRRYNLNYKQESKGRHYWTVSHIDWLTVQLNKVDKVLGLNLELQLSQYRYITETIERYDSEVTELSNLERYKSKVEALSYFRGISTLSAMILITEIGDIRRFPHPENLSSYVGLDVKEYSSGGKERRFGITKMGNHHIRTTLVEACQSSGRHCALSKRLQKSRRGQPQKLIDIADKCMNRLKKKFINLQRKDKHINKIKVACARELLCFVWEMLMEVEGNKNNKVIRKRRVV